MAETLEITSPLSGYSENFNGITLFEPALLDAVAIAVSPNGEAKLKRFMKAEFQLALPSAGNMASKGDNRLIWTQPDQFLLMGKKLNFSHLEEGLEACATITDQSDAFAHLIIEGGAATTALERICPLDLSDAAFGISTAQRTMMEHLSVTIMRDAKERFTLLSPRSSAQSFLHAVEQSCRSVS